MYQYLYFLKLFKIYYTNNCQFCFQVYYDMYEKSKEKYAADMEEYTLNKSINAVQTPNFQT